MIQSVDRAMELLKALAGRSRLLLLCHLCDGEKSVGELAQLVEARDAAVSQQLALLRKDGLVVARRSGQTIYYSLASNEVVRVLETLHGLYCTPAPEPAEAELETAGDKRLTGARIPPRRQAGRSGGNVVDALGLEPRTR